jgi:hypothetical protein
MGEDNRGIMICRRRVLQSRTSDRSRSARPNGMFLALQEDGVGWIPHLYFVVFLSVKGKQHFIKKKQKTSFWMDLEDL